MARDYESTRFQNLEEHPFTFGPSKKLTPVVTGFRWGMWLGIAAVIVAGVVFGLFLRSYLTSLGYLT